MFIPTMYLYHVASNRFMWGFCYIIEISESHLILATLFTKPDKKLKEVNPDEYEKEGFPVMLSVHQFGFELTEHRFRVASYDSKWNLKRFWSNFKRKWFLKTLQQLWYCLWMWYCLMLWWNLPKLTTIKIVNSNKTISLWNMYNLYINQCSFRLQW